MRIRELTIPFLKLAVTLLALGLFSWAPRALGADHREAPLVDSLPEGDITDVFLFTDPNDSSRVVMIMNVNPFSVPAELSSYSLSPDFLYQFKIDNDGDAREDLVIQVVVDVAGQGQTIRVFGPMRPEKTGQRNNLSDDGPSISGKFGQVFGSASGVQAFVGMRDDPFVFDVGQFFRILNGTQDVFRGATSPVLGPLRGRSIRAAGTPGAGTSGVDGFGGFDVTSIVVSFPKSMIRGHNSKINMWATVSQRISDRRGGGRSYIQFERMGQQVFATVFIPKGAPRDAENAEIPEHDVANYSGLIPDALTNNDASGNTISARNGLLAALGVTSLPNGAPLAPDLTNAKNTDPSLLRAALLPDVLRFDLDQPTNNPNDPLEIGQFGIQNGRPLDYPSVDVALQLLRQLADVKFPNGSNVPGSGPLGARHALDCTALPRCPDPRVLVVLQGTTFNKPDGDLTDFSKVGNDRPFLTDSTGKQLFPFVAVPHPLPGEPGTVGFPDQQ